MNITVSPYTPPPAVTPRDSAIADLAKTLQATPGAWYAVDGWESDGTLSPISEQIRRALSAFGSGVRNGSRYEVSRAHDGSAIIARYLDDSSGGGKSDR